MTRWEFEPGHTAAEFRAKRMTVTWVRWLLKNVHGVVDLDFDNPTNSSFEAESDATKLWTGGAGVGCAPAQCRPLRRRAPSADHFRSTGIKQVESVRYKGDRDLTIGG
jgi:polyisoprenoid-binding protein YceI